jgi:formylglycine-generating enzyme required for sulfatase activity
VTTLDCEDDICWVKICGGDFEMGDDDNALTNQAPLHTVQMPTFEIMESETTVAMYTRCVDDGGCDVHSSTALCDDLPDDRPRTCIDWERSRQFCAWLGARMVTEAEYEFASRSRGADYTYPWGNAEPTCDLARMGCDVCETFLTAPVCTHPDGNTDQGLCDMAGNAIEWTADYYHNTYDGAPIDGGVWDYPESVFRVMRGGGVGSCAGPETRHRTFHEPDFWYAGGSVRCARDRVD